MRWRKMTWVVIVWCVLILAWAIGGAAGNNCDQATYRGACETGTGIGVLLILFVGFFGFAFLALIWFMTRPRGRPCPRCGQHVQVGWTRCQTCGYDFALATLPPPAPPPPPPPPAP